MAPRRSFFERLFRQTAGQPGDREASPARENEAPAWPSPERPTRMVVSGEVTGPTGKLPFGPGGTVPPERLPSFARSRPTPLARHLSLVRDSAAVLLVIVLAVIVLDRWPRDGQAVLGETGAPSGTAVGQVSGSPAPAGSGVGPIESASGAGPSESPAAITFVPPGSPGASSGPTGLPSASPSTQPTPTPFSTWTPAPTSTPAPTGPPPTGTPVPTAPPSGAPAPVASIAWSCRSGSRNIAFDGSGSTAATSWAWDFGDGATSTKVSVHHLFATGSWTVRLTVTGPGGSDVATAQVVAPCA